MKSVSLYVPCFNAEETLAPCLEAALCQSVPVEEVVVVDDGSTDRTAQIAGRYPVKLIRHGVNRGLAASRNSAIRQTRGALVASLDADCVCEKDWLKSLLEPVAQTGVAGAGGKLLETNNRHPADLWRSVHMQQHWGDAAGRPPFLFGANTIFHRDALEAAGFYDETLKNNYEDVDLCSRLERAGYAFAYEPKAVVYHLRQDGPAAVLDSYGRWYAAYYRREGFFQSPEKFRFKLKETLGTANRYVEEDMSAGRRPLVYLDILFAFHHACRDLASFLAEARGEPAQETTRLSLWSAFVDLVFFSRMDADAEALRSLLTPTSAYEQNCFALAFVLGRYLKEKFPVGPFPKILFRHLFLTLFGIDDTRLCDAFFEVTERQPEWRCFLEKGHPYLDRDFLETFVRTFQEMMERLIFRFPDILTTITASTDIGLGTGEDL